MDKTINITLSGLIFSFTEDAYLILKAYLDRLEKNLNGQEGSDEITEDIENRIAELCNDIIATEKRVVIYVSDIEGILEQMGNPDDFIDNDTFEEAETKTESKSETNNESTKENTSKQVFRDEDNSIIGGVCSGVGAYFNVDPIVLRGIFIIMFFGFGSGFLLYLVLWIIIPKAKTSSDKLRMRGESVNLQNIKSTVNQKAENLKKNNTIGDNITNGVQNVFRVLGPIFGAFLIFIGLSGFITILIAAYSNLGIWIDGDYGVIGSLSELLSYVFDNSFDNYIAHITFIVLCTVPTIFIMLLGLQVLVKRISKNIKYIYLSIAILWGLSFAGAVYSGVQVSRMMRVTNSTVQEHKIATNNEVLIIDADFQPFYSELEQTDDAIFLTKEESIYFFNPNLRIVPSYDSLIHITLIYESDGRTGEQAKTKSENIEYNYDLKGNVLTLNGYYSFPKEQRLRNQEVTISIAIPEGKKIILKPALKNMLDDIKNHKNIYDKDMINREWEMNNNSLRCVNCTGNERTVKQ